MAILVGDAAQPAPSAAAPTLDGHPVPMGPDRWIDLPPDLHAVSIGLHARKPQ